MFAKIFVLVLGLGVIACGLLSQRQSRLQAASELAQAQLRIASADDRLWSMRTQVSAAITPTHVQQLAQDVGPLKPIIMPDPVGPPTPGASLPVYAANDVPPVEMRSTKTVSYEQGAVRGGGDSRASGAVTSQPSYRRNAAKSAPAKPVAKAKGAKAPKRETNAPVRRRQ